MKKKILKTLLEDNNISSIFNDIILIMHYTKVRYNIINFTRILRDKIKKASNHEMSHLELRYLKRALNLIEKFLGRTT